MHIQSVNPYSPQDNFLQNLPEDVLGEVCSFLSMKHLGYLNSLSKSFAGTALSNIMWKRFAQSHLPQAYQKLPGVILKQKLKSEYETLKPKIDLILENADRKIGFLRPERAFSQELIAHLENKNVFFLDKGAAINADSSLRAKLHKLYWCIRAQAPQVFADCELTYNLEHLVETFDIFLKLVNVNFYDKRFPVPLLFAAIEDKRIDIAKKLIDAGADINMKAYEGASIWHYVKEAEEHGGYPGCRDALLEVVSYVKEKDPLAVINFSRKLAR